MKKPYHKRETLLVFCLFFAVTCSTFAQIESPQEQFVPESGQEGKDVVWVPTPQELVEKMLDLAEVQALGVDPFKTELLKNTNIISIARANTTPDIKQSSIASYDFSWDGRQEGDNFPVINVMGVDADYLKTFNMEMVEGRFRCGMNDPFLNLPQFLIPLIRAEHYLCGAH